MSRRMFIPPLGTIVTLAADWTFILHREHRNKDLFVAAGFPNPHDIFCNGPTKQFTITAGTALRIERIYIRQGNTGFDSVTFRIMGSKGKPRFWAKLSDVNNIEIESIRSGETPTKEVA